MNLCDSCKKWKGCENPAKHASTPPDRVDGCMDHAPITRADLAARDAEVANLSDAVRFLAKQETKLFKIRGEAIRLLAGGNIGDAKDLVMMHWPIIQGLRNQFDLEEIGNQPCDMKHVRPAIDFLLAATGAKP